MEAVISFIEHAPFASKFIHVGGSEIGNNSASASKDLVADVSTNRRHYAKFHKVQDTLIFYSRS
jgi:hypothetical protein